MPDDLIRTRNPIQKVQGYIELGGKPITTTDKDLQTVFVQELLPSKHVRLVYPATNTAAPMYDSSGITILEQFVRADEKAFYAFYAETGQYDIRFTEPGTNPIVEIFRQTDVKIESRVYNVRDYGARGDGVADDTLAIRKALQTMIDAYNNIQGVGKLFFPNGRYLVRKQVDLLNHILDLPSGIVIEGTAGPVTGGTTSNCQIVLDSEECSIFRIRTDRHKIIIRDIGLTTTGSHNNTIAVDAREIEANLPNTYTSGIELDNVTIWNFWRGFSVEGSANNLQWDISGIRIDHCTIVDCDYAVYLNSQTCDFCKITNSRIGAILSGYGIYMDKVGSITLDSILGAGTVQNDSMSNTFIYMTPVHGAITISNSESEGFLNSMQVAPNIKGNIGWPIMVTNCAFGAPILLSSNCDYVSVGNRYAPGVVKCTHNGTDVMIYSFGDLCAPFPGDIPHPGDDPFVLLGNSRLVARSNRFRVDSQLPARFGGKAGLIPGWLEHTPLAISSFKDSEEEAQIVLCNEEGLPRFRVRADADYIYFEKASRKKLMRLDNDGNLVIAGRLEENGML